ncbi:prepilin-type N-terminal cleavage/methylation domain-containing protein [Synechococcus elongatus]|uniref:Prepilin-type N-terminal cleavage/methylation domain-containing protein n=1 Tax=Synechococcus elongatus PCC 11802 TaxID=2283154 RepID=A0AAT9JV16_SYNEL|nr:prepilin-type N-terminal cleavage/methylation domain-containing protein [Synechococcus elongatus]
MTRTSRSQGFTITEILIVIIIVGILAAVTTPSLAGFVGQQQTNQATSEVQASILEMVRETQRTNIEEGCKLLSSDITVTRIIRRFTPATNPNCLLNSRSFPPGTTIADNNFNGVSIVAYGTGNVRILSGTNPISIASIQLSNTKSPAFQRCVQVAAPQGLVRTGRMIGGTCVIDQIN